MGEVRVVSAAAIVVRPLRAACAEGSPAAGLCRTAPATAGVLVDSCASGLWSHGFIANVVAAACTGIPRTRLHGAILHCSVVRTTVPHKRPIDLLHAFPPPQFRAHRCREPVGGEHQWRRIRVFAPHKSLSYVVIVPTARALLHSSMPVACGCPRYWRSYGCIVATLSLVDMSALTPLAVPSMGTLLTHGLAYSCLGFTITTLPPLGTSRCTGLVSASTDVLTTIVAWFRLGAGCCVAMPRLT